MFNTSLIQSAIAAALIATVSTPALAEENQEMVAPVEASTDVTQGQIENIVSQLLYPGMVQVWSEDRRGWHNLISAYACLPNSSETSDPTLALQQKFVSLIELSSEVDAKYKLLLQDISAIGYQLFAASYAHGYAKQLHEFEARSGGVLDEFCFQGNSSEANGLVFEGLSVDDKIKNSLGAFSKLLDSQGKRFDMLAFSHAYESPDLFESLFFELNGEQNLAQYSSTLSEEMQGASLDVSSHAEFQFLTLTSGYHWGTLSAHAMLAESFPKLYGVVREDIELQMAKFSASDQQADG